MADIHLYAMAEFRVYSFVCTLSCVLFRVYFFVCTLWCLLFFTCTFKRILMDFDVDQYAHTHIHALHIHTYIHEYIFTYMCFHKNEDTHTYMTHIADKIRHRCNTDATQMQHRCNTDATQMQHRCNAFNHSCTILDMDVNMYSYAPTPHTNIFWSFTYAHTTGFSLKHIVLVYTHT